MKIYSQLKRSASFLLFGLFSLALISCGEIKEEIVIKADGSGSYDVSADIIPMMRKMMTGMAAMLDEDDLTDEQIAQKVEDMIWKDFPNEVDSVLDFSDKLDAETLADKEKMRILENVTLYMRGGRDLGYMKTGVSYPFSNSADFEQMQALLGESSKADPKAALLSQAKTDIKIGPNSFYRSSVVPENDDENYAAVAKMMAGSKITTVLQFDKKISSVNVETYEIVKQEAKSITLSYSLADALTAGKRTTIDIKLK